MLVFRYAPTAETGGRHRLTPGSVCFSVSAHGSRDRVGVAVEARSRKLSRVAIMSGQRGGEPRSMSSHSPDDAMILVRPSWMMLTWRRPGQIALDALMGVEKVLVAARFHLETHGVERGHGAPPLAVVRIGAHGRGAADAPPVLRPVRPASARSSKRPRPRASCGRCHAALMRSLTWSSVSPCFLPK